MTRIASPVFRPIATLAFCAAVGLAATPGAASVVEIKKNGSAFQLLRDGQPYLAKGVAGGSGYLDKLVAAGGNTVRTYGADKYTLDKAQAAGVAVLVGISGTDLASAKLSVTTYKDHSAVLMWGLGNEMELQTTNTTALWQGVETIAAAVKLIDPNHPIITVVAELGGTKLADIKRLCPSLDAIGVNSYGSAGTLATRVPAGGWDKAFLVTEFGPKGHWEVPKTAWGLPIEPTSTEKADTYLASYRSLAAAPACLGTFAFLWGQKQEKTHTWYGMFMADGTPLSPVEAMTEAWTGAAPANKGPRIGAGKVKMGPGDGSQRRFQPGAQVICQLDVADPDGPMPTVTWDLRVDVSDNPGQGGAPEPNSKPIPEAILKNSGADAMVQIPDSIGHYRLFAYAKDAVSGWMATANAPIDVAKDAPAVPGAIFDKAWGRDALRPVPGANGTLKALSLTLSQPERVTLMGYAANGSLAANVPMGRLAPGTHVFPLPKRSTASPVLWEVRLGSGLKLQCLPAR
ncbi:MAG: hypothetical protein JWO30_4513 [Fibrobacteres bacterium]|nr:hypothetical protein [Fibrobacterota bacterium]